MLKINRPIPVDRVRLLIFDLDGTLIDSRVDLANSVNAMHEHFVNDALGYFLAWYREHKLDNTYVYPGILEALDRLSVGPSGAGRKMAVLTNKPVNPSQAIVEALGLSKYFFRVYG
jgi:phosphoglycolate phosphatase